MSSLLDDFFCWLESMMIPAGDTFDYVGTADAILREIYAFFGL
jgi:hypothetical protein